MVDIYVGPENTHWVLHEKLLCARSKFFAKIFYSDGRETARTKTFGLPDEEDDPFKLFVGWLYSGAVIPPREENDLTPLYELYLMGEKWQIAGLIKDVLDAVRSFYRTTQTYPGLRRVQYMYANTDADSPMRQLLIGSIARMLTLGDGIPTHWDKALRKNGQLAVDLILAIQNFHISEDEVPDFREGPGDIEKEKVKTVEKAEAKQEGKAKDIKAAANGRPSGLTNGVHHEEDDAEEEEDEEEN